MIAIAMVASMSIAAMAGAGIPLIPDSVGQDPARSSSIILTTLTDVTGFLSFLELATLLASILEGRRHPRMPLTWLSLRMPLTGLSRWTILLRRG